VRGGALLLIFIHDTTDRPVPSEPWGRLQKALNQQLLLLLKRTKLPASGPGSSKTALFSLPPHSQSMALLLGLTPAGTTACATDIFDALFSGVGGGALCELTPRHPSTAPSGPGAVGSLVRY
jgi:hypothetical protein